MAQDPVRDAEFTAFVAAASPTLGRTAWLLTGNPEAAAALLQATLVKTYVAWPRVQPGGAASYAEDTMAALGGRAQDGPQRPATRPPADDVDNVAVDLEAVLDAGREAVRGRRLGWTVAGITVLAVVSSIVTPLLIAQTVPPPPAASPAAPGTQTLRLEGTTWYLSPESGEWVRGRGVTLRVDDSRVSGETGCGSYTATLERTGGRWAITGLRNTAMTCPTQSATLANRFLARLARITSGEVGSDRLRLESPEGPLVFSGP